MTKNVLFGVLISAMSLAPLQIAADMVDQSQTISTTTMAHFAQADLAQSFQQAYGDITGAEILLTDFGGTESGDVTIELWDALPTNAGSLLATGTDFGVTDGQWATVSFGGPVSITPDTTYYLLFFANNNNLGINGDTSDPYSRGQVYANAGFGEFPFYDYTFQTFTSVPEPSGALLAGLLVAIGSYRRRR